MDDALLHTLLPDDPGQLRSLVLTLASQRDQWKRKHDEKERARQQLELERQKLELERQKLEVEKQRLELHLLLLMRQRYGRKADRLRTPGDAAQLLLDFAREGLAPLPEAGIEDAAAIADDATPVDLSDVDLRTVRQVRPARRGVRGGRLDLSQCHHLPLIRREYDLPEEQRPCPCCGTLRERIGSESAWQLEIIPAILQRIEHVRLKYGCSWCERHGHNPQIELAGKPASPIDKGLPGPGLLAHVVTGKFADYLPLYRLEQQFAREGLAIGRATMSVWCRDVARLLMPLHRLMVERVKQSRVVCTDDTTMPMQDPGNGKTRPARMWVYVGDEDHPYDVFDFTLGRGRDGPARFLRDFHGTLLADAYVGYDAVVVGNDLVRAGCWAHARRKFIEAESTHPGIAKEVVDLIGKLYAVERRGKAMNARDRLALRTAESRPLLEQLHHRLSSWQLQLLPRHPMQQAIGYVLRQWKELTVFAKDGAVPIDNNISEREMKRIVLNRKNSLFVGNERGGHTAAILASFTSTCRRHGIDPRSYLTQLLTNLPDTPLSQLEGWLPDRWKRSQAQPDTS